MRLLRYTAAACAASALAVAFAGTASAGRYVVVFKNGTSGAGVAAVHQAGGKIVRNTRVGVATVVASSPSFAARLSASGAVAGVAHDASFSQPDSAKRPLHAAANPSTTERATCQALYGSSSPSGPDELAPCQWDMQRIHANPGSYSIDQGAGARLEIGRASCREREEMSGGGGS